MAPPDPTNSGLATFTSGLPASQQFGNALGLILMQLGAHVVAVNGSDGRTLWQHPTYNQTTPRITGYRCGRGAG